MKGYFPWEHLVFQGKSFNGNQLTFEAITAGPHNIWGATHRITINLLENHWVSIRCGRSNTKMVGMAKSNFTSLPAIPTAGVV